MNEKSAVNNMRLVRCAERDFVVTVDESAFVRMIYLDNLDKDPIKFLNKHPGAHDNSTWSVDGTSCTPPRVVVGSNAHAISIFNLSTDEIQKVKAHQHNVPAVSFSPCGKFISSASIDKKVKIWH